MQVGDKIKLTRKILPSNWTNEGREPDQRVWWETPISNEWVVEMDNYIGKIGIIQRIHDESCEVEVSFPETTEIEPPYTYPSCCFAKLEERVSFEQS